MLTQKPKDNQGQVPFLELSVLRTQCQGNPDQQRSLKHQYALPFRQFETLEGQEMDIELFDHRQQILEEKHETFKTAREIDFKNGTDSVQHLLLCNDPMEERLEVAGNQLSHLTKSILILLICVNIHRNLTVFSDTATKQNIIFMARG